ncbi:MAG: UvrD-helicase domain-containing protein [Bacteroidota bacterium]
MQITNNDIARVEKIFFGDNGTFEDDKNERYNFISCIDRSIDVEACPGSGKTTSLLAKLYLLSEKMPFADGKGLCVLTHTNVGINEIKNNLGHRSEKLFQYPNFFGTIQSFIDKFLAIPYYSNKNHERVAVIDSDRAFSRLFTTFAKGVSHDDLKMVREFLHANGDIAFRLTYKQVEEQVYDLVKGIDGNKIEPKKPQRTKGKYAGWSNEEKIRVYNSLNKLKASILKSGVLSYDDAYFYANEYLRAYPEIKNAFSSRFSHIFVDEMQDTYTHQDVIIKLLFDDKVIIQRIGDTNQAILNDNDGVSAWEDSERMNITESRRFSQPIANILKTVALKSNPDLKGRNEFEIPPYIIKYKNEEKDQVIEKFAALLPTYDLAENKQYKYPVKAVGWVGKDKDGLTIKSYFPSFNKKISSKTPSFKSLLAAITYSNISEPKEFFNTVIDCLVEILRRSEIKNSTTKGERYYSRTSLLNFLKQKFPVQFNVLTSEISAWTIQSFSGENPTEEIKTFTKDIFFPAVNIALKDYSLKFIDSDEMEDISDQTQKQKNVFYSGEPHLCHVPIEVATVHSVKGETHRATLYLETSFHKPCGEYLLDQLTGVAYVRKKAASRKEMCLKVAHVGMSRPTHLLCVALNETLVEENRKALEENGWKII